MCNFPPRKGDIDLKKSAEPSSKPSKAAKEKDTGSGLLEAKADSARFGAPSEVSMRIVPRGFAERRSGVPTKAVAWALQFTRQGKDPIEGSAFETIVKWRAVSILAAEQ